MPSRRDAVTKEETVAEYVVRTCAEQGVPVLLEDRQALSRVTAIVARKPFPDPEGVAERVARSRAAQGLPPRITDPATLATVGNGA